MAEADWVSDEFWEDVRTPANPLPLLQKWYQFQCNGEWEHKSGISITTCDNPGWWVKINVLGTAVEGKIFQPVTANVSNDRLSHGERWVCCELKNSVWHGACDPRSLNRILNIFLDWAADVAPNWPTKPKKTT